MERNARLVIIASNQLLRECLASALIDFAQLENVDHYGHPEEMQGDPATYDALLMDISQPWDRALQFVRDLSRVPNPVKILLLGVDPSAEAEAMRYIEAGARASLPVETTFEEMCGVIERVLAGEAVYPPSIASSMFSRLAELASEQRRNRRLEAMILTPRELQILRLLADGLRNTTIASRLQISVHTVKNHVHHILDKLEVGDRTEAVAQAIQRGWLEDLRGQRSDLSEAIPVAGGKTE